MNKLQNKRLTKLGNHLLNGGDHLAGWNYNHMIILLGRDSIDGEETEKRTKALTAGKSSTISTASGTLVLVVPKKRLCGTIGCALGECTILFPRKFKAATSYNSYNNIMLSLYIHSNKYNTWKSTFSGGEDTIVEFFGLHEYLAYSVLFMPTDNGRVTYKEKRVKVIRLPNEATMKQVGQNILNYLKIFGS